MPRWGLNHALHHAPYCFYLAIPVSARERLRGAVVRGVHGKLITHLAARHRHQEPITQRRSGLGSIGSQ